MRIKKKAALVLGFCALVPFTAIAMPSETAVAESSTDIMMTMPAAQAVMPQGLQVKMNRLMRCEPTIWSATDNFQTELLLREFNAGIYDERALEIWREYIDAHVLPPFDDIVAANPLALAEEIDFKRLTWESKYGKTGADMWIMRIPLAELREASDRLAAKFWEKAFSEDVTNAELRYLRSRPQDFTGFNQALADEGEATMRRAYTEAYRETARKPGMQGIRDPYSNYFTMGANYASPLRRYEADGEVYYAQEVLAYERARDGSLFLTTLAAHLWRDGDDLIAVYTLADKDSPYRFERDYARLSDRVYTGGWQPVAGEIIPLKGHFSGDTMFSLDRGGMLSRMVMSKWGFMPQAQTQQWQVADNHCVYTANILRMKATPEQMQLWRMQPNEEGLARIFTFDSRETGAMLLAQVDLFQLVNAPYLRIDRFEHQPWQRVRGGDRPLYLTQSRLLLDIGGYEQYFYLEAAVAEINGELRLYGVFTDDARRSLFAGKLIPALKKAEFAPAEQEQPQVSISEWGSGNE